MNIESSDWLLLETLNLVKLVFHHYSELVVIFVEEYGTDVFEQLAINANSDPIAKLLFSILEEHFE